MAIKQTTPDPILPFATQRKFAAWLAKHHATRAGIWIKIAKAASGIPSIKYAEAVETALCWGWIDSQTKGIDQDWYVQRFYAARQAKPMVQNQLREGQSAHGRRQDEVCRAGGNRARKKRRTVGSRVRLTSPSDVPADLAAALARNRKASDFFARLDAHNRYAILHRVQTATKPETRARRIGNFVRMLTRKEKLYP